MPRNTLLDFFEDYSRQDAVFLVHDDGYRTRQATYREVGDAAHRLQTPCGALGSSRTTRSSSGPRTGRSGSSRSGAACSPASWSCPSTTARRPISSAAVSAIVNAKWVLVGDEVELPAGVTGEVRKLSEAVRAVWSRWKRHPARGGAHLESGAACRDHLHLRRDRRTQRRDDHASERPREHHPDRAGDREVPEVHAAVPSASVS